MNPERWKQITELYSIAAASGQSERERVLHEVSGSDADLRRELESLLAYEGRASTFMELPAVDIVSRIDHSRWTSDSIPVGGFISHYRILERIGAGGMGVVYKAEDVRLHRYVALKFIPDVLRNDAIALLRLQREAQAASALNHPNICTIYDIDITGEHPFVAMELLEGKTLAELLSGQPMEAESLLKIAIQVSEGLSEAHDHGILHRDIKPANIFVTRNNQVKLLDFGISKSAAGQVDGIDGSTLTGPGAVIGTVAYMSPEQARGEKLDVRTDIFSLGSILYEMAAGQPAFSGSTSAIIFSSLLNDIPPRPVRSINPEVPPRLEHIIHKALEKSPEYRYQHASELTSDLRVLHHHLEASQNARVAKGHVTSDLHDNIEDELRGSRIGKVAVRLTTVPLLLAIVILAVASVTYLAVYKGTQTSTVSYEQITNDGHPKLSGDLNDAHIVTDGARLYFTDSNAELYQVAVTGGETIRLPAPFPVPQVILDDISPNGSELLVSHYEPQQQQPTLWTLATVGGPPKRLGNLMGQDGTWSPDGSKLLYTAGHDLMLASDHGTKVHKLLSVPGVPYWLRFSPDGTAVRFTIANSNDNSLSLWEMTSQGRNLHPLLPGWNNPSRECCGSWTSDGKYFLFQATKGSRTDIWALNEHAGISFRSTRPRMLTTGPLNYYSPVPSRDGKRIFVVGTHDRVEIVRCDSASGAPEVYLSGLSAESIDISRDGQWITYVTPEGSLWRGKFDGTERLQLTFPPMRVFLPRWSPDGQTIAFAARTDNKPWMIYLVSPSSGSVRPITTSGANDGDVGWSPDGRKLIFGTMSDVDANPASPGIHVLDLRTHKESELPDSDKVFSPRWSPDGRYVAAIGEEGRKLVLFDFRSGRWSALAAVNPIIGFPSWSHDGHYIYFDDGLIDNATIYRVSIANRKLTKLVQLRDLHRSSTPFGVWFGLGPNDSLLATRYTGSQEIYALHWDQR